VVWSGEVSVQCSDMDVCVVQDAKNVKLCAKDSPVSVSCADVSANGRPVLTSWDYVEYHRLPEFLHDNEFLKRRHRPELNSAAECLKSAFMLHSETWNIWTHVFGKIYLETLKTQCCTVCANKSSCL